MTKYKIRSDLHIVIIIIIQIILLLIVIIIIIIHLILIAPFIRTQGSLQCGRYNVHTNGLD